MIVDLRDMDRVNDPCECTTSTTCAPCTQRAVARSQTSRAPIGHIEDRLVLAEGLLHGVVRYFAGRATARNHTRLNRQQLGDITPVERQTDNPLLVHKALQAAGLRFENRSGCRNRNGVGHCARG